MALEFSKVEPALLFQALAIAVAKRNPQGSVTGIDRWD
jgi:hypothetical protein